MFVWLGAACAPRREPAKPSPAPEGLHTGPLTDFVPAAGLRWMVVARLAELAHTPSLASALELLFPGPRIAAFAISTGLDLRNVPVGVAAGFDYSTLYVAEAHEEGALVESRFVDRLAGAGRITSPHPSVRRISGTLGLVPETFLHVRDKLVAVSVGDPTPARVLELYALGRLRRSPTALRGSALATLPVFDDAPLRLYAPGPFTGEWATGARGLLGVAVALGAIARVEGDVLRVRIFLTGRFEPVDKERLSSAWNDLAESSMGKLLGFDRVETPPQAEAAANQISLEVRLKLMPLASGLRAAVAADVWEILDVPPPQNPNPSSVSPTTH